MNRTIVITGGSDGLGKSIAQAFSLTDNVYILAPNEEKLKKISEELGCKYLVCDVADTSSSEKAIDHILSNNDKIDILINNAGLWIQGEVENNDLDYIKRVIDVNFFGIINLCNLIIPSMKRQRDGLIINVNSLSGYFFKAKRTVYNSTKWAVTGFTGSLRYELEPFGVRVTDFHPGLMKTSMFDKANVNKDTEQGMDTDSVAKVLKLISDIPKNIVIPDIGVINNIYYKGDC